MTTRTRKTAYEKIEHLLRIDPNLQQLKIALRHFSDEALVRELQRRDAMPQEGDKAYLNNNELLQELRDRDLNLADRQELRECIETKDWERVEALYWSMI